MKQLVLVLLAGCTLAGCETLQLDEPKTLGEINTGYNYIPVDPLAVGVAIEPPPLPANATAAERRRLRYQRCVSRRMAEGDKPADVMDALPDHTVRMAIREMSGEANAGFSAVAMGVKGSLYQVVVDSVLADTVNVPFAIRARARRGEGDRGAPALMDLTDENARDLEFDAVRLLPGMTAAQMGSDYEDVHIPIYVGVGLRMTAHLAVRSGKVNLSSLPALAASVEAKKSAGSLTMQTLGIYNQQVASTFPIPSELNTSTIQNALLSLGAVKAIVYDGDTGTRPRVTGIYNPLPTSDPKLINKIYSALASAPIPWIPCDAA